MEALAVLVEGLVALVDPRILHLLVGVDCTPVEHCEEAPLVLVDPVEPCRLVGGAPCHQEVVEPCLQEEEAPSHQAVHIPLDQVPRVDLEVLLFHPELAVQVVLEVLAVLDHPPKLEGS